MTGCWGAEVTGCWGNGMRGVEVLVYRASTIVNLFVQDNLLFITNVLQVVITVIIAITQNTLK